MKKVILKSVITLLLFITSASSFGKNSNLGLIGDLVEIKLSGENFVLETINNDNLSQEVKVEVMRRYNLLRIIVEKSISQMVADMQLKNSKRPYKKVNNMLKEYGIFGVENTVKMNKNYVRYVVAFEKVSIAYKGLKNYIDNLDQTEPIISKAFLPTEIGEDAILGAFSFITATIKQISDSKEKRIDKIVAILKELRLKPIQNLIKSEESEEESDENGD